jgi:hypothetical protein
MAQPVDSLDLPFEQRLRLYTVNRDAARTELLRVKMLYRSEYPTASQERLNQISSWARSVRSAAGIAEDDPIYGNSAFVSSDFQDALVNWGQGQTGGGGTTGLGVIKSNADNFVTLAVGGLVLLIFAGMFGK